MPPPPRDSSSVPGAPLSKPPVRTSAPDGGEVVGRCPSCVSEGAIRWILGHAPYLAGRPDLAVTGAEHAVHSGVLSPAETARFEASSSVALFTLGRLDEAEAIATEVIPAARDLGELGALADAFKSLAVVRLLRGHAEQALDFVERALDVAQASETPRNSSIVLYQIRGHCLLQLGKADEAERAMDIARRIAEHGWGNLLPQCYFSRAFVLFAVGRWDDALAEIEAGLPPVAELATNRMAPALHGLATIIAVHRGDLPTARARLAEVDRAAPWDVIPFYAFVGLWARCLLEHAQGHPDRALDRYRGSMDWGLRIWNSMPVWLVPGVVRLAVRAGRLETARDVVAALAAYVAQSADPPLDLTTAVIHCRGIVDNDSIALAEISDYYENSAWILLRSQYYEDMAAALVTINRRSDARVQLGNALDLYTGLGAVWLAQDVGSRLRALGVQRGARGRRPRRPVTGWNSLTETERRVALLVAEGLSNPLIATRLFVSRRTVEYHVSNILAKLGATGRVELAAVVARLR